MGWYKIGNRILSEREMHATSGSFLDIVVPSIVTGICVWPLTNFLPKFQFFVAHTATAKLIYVVCGIFVFVISYAYRKFIVTLCVISFFVTILLLSGIAFLGWIFS